MRKHLILAASAFFLFGLSTPALAGDEDAPAKRDEPVKKKEVKSAKKEEVKKDSEAKTDGESKEAAAPISYNIGVDGMT